MAEAEDRLMAWLRDAHAAEQQAETMLSGMARRLKHYPEFRSRIEQHIEETKRQASDLRDCIKRRNGSTSTLKDTGASLLGFGQAMSGMFTSDEVLKGAIAGYAFEAMEIASYKILIVAARSVGDEQTASVCENALREEEEMAEWLDNNISALTDKFLAREEVGATAKN
jgi:ferritin-like metal-binding protein YciE